MNDRFKFRVWSKKYNNFIEDNRYPIGSDQQLIITQYGTLIKLGLGDFEDDCEDSYSWATFNDYEQDCIVMQCTGLKDKNGKLIYEGDIVAHTKTKYTQRYIVNWNNKGFWQLDDNAMARSAKFLEENYEVISNIYENKSLLESEG